MTRDEMDAAIAKAIGFPPPTRKLRDRIAFVAGMRAATDIAADIARSSKGWIASAQTVAIALHAAADKLERP